MAEYFLPRHVHFCCRGDDFVFLDLRQDDYTLVNGNAAGSLRILSPTGQLSDSRTESIDALKQLLEGGLLTTDRSVGKEIRATNAELALELLVEADAMLPGRPSIPQLCRFMAACTTALARLRWSRIEDTVKAVEQRKARHVSHQDFDMNLARELTAVFHKLRALFPHNYLCLFDSLALLEFLARYGIFPTWVFGIKLEPWAAHCWVQEGQFVFNEGVEEAASYTPIMTI